MSDDTKGWLICISVCVGIAAALLFAYRDLPDFKRECERTGGRVLHGQAFSYVCVRDQPK